MIKIISRTVAFLAIMGGLLFGSAGRLDWLMGWAYLAVLTTSTITILALGNREMLLVRAGKEKGTKKWDPFLAGLSFLLFWPGANVVAALDYGRFHWSPTVPLLVQLIALITFALGLAFAAWAIITNKFFAKCVAIQTEREHVVITTGPYAYVRHPGYAGAVLAFITLPIALGSLWALLPAAVGLTILAVRTFLEDRTLQKDLEGYTEYAQQVPWRLIPHIW
ncbi:MAG: isoprenylcysteine carboxylmethyltransferase family protein [Planctomycetes bacterium]|nr:isoprenylcysteine carboxylmethyltransferase family protein [Planctomycetota bacterium]